MANFSNAVIRIPLRSPLIVHSASGTRRLCLCSVIAGQEMERTGDPDAAMAIIPRLLDHWIVGDGKTVIPIASQIIFQSPIRSRTVIPFTRSIFRVVNDPEIRTRIAGVNWNNKPETLQRGYKFPINVYEAIEVDAVYYVFRGDYEQVEKAFRRAYRIGALRKKGGGEIDIDRVAAEPVPNQSALFGLVCAGQLMRPVPAFVEPYLIQNGDIGYVDGAIENWQTPFHAEETKVSCLVPVQAGSEMVLTPKQIADLLQ